jgi:hypothetical protein
MWATNFILGPLSNSDPSQPKNGLQVRHNNVRHVPNTMSEPPTHALDVAAMLASRPHLHGRVPCCPAERSVAPKGENRAYALTLCPPPRSLPLYSR